MKRKNNKYIIANYVFIGLIFILFGICFLFKNTLFKSIVFIIISIVIFIGLIISLIVNNIKYVNYVKSLEKRLSLFNNVTYHVKGAGEFAFNELPIGILIIDNEYKIAWSNDEAKKILLSSLDNLYLKDVANSLLFNLILNNESSNILCLYENYYEVDYVEKNHAIYLKDITKSYNLNVRYQNKMVAVGLINVDNLDEAISNLDVQERTNFTGTIIKEIDEWASSYGAFVRSLSESRYLFITDQEHLMKMENDKFPILDTIKLIIFNARTNIVTLSVGIYCNDLSVEELSKGAEEAIELAQNRGGDQVVVNCQGSLSFYGAKSEPSRKDSKVEKRFKYQELERLMNSASSIFCIGHNNQDPDAFGACLGLYNLGIALGKPTYIILTHQATGDIVDHIYDEVEKLHLSLESAIVTPDRAMELKNNDSLLIIADCQAESQLFISKNQIYSFKHIAIIDHHRKNEFGTVEHPDFIYCDPAASSTVELIVCLFKACDKEITISSLDATWMLLGMVVDTNNFVYRTSSVTFEVAAYLNELKADTGRVQEYLKEDINEKILKNRLISEAETYREIIAIAKDEKEEYFQPAMLAKISDELLKLKGIELALSVGYSSHGVVRVSARSLGRFNCQVLMEKLGGGGHLGAAACVISNHTIEEVVYMLKKAIDEMMESNEGMTKVILITRIKNVGIRGTTVDTSFEQAKKWCDQNLAILATYENLRIFEEEKEEEKAVAQKNLKKYLDLKEALEKEPITIRLKLGKDGIIHDSKIFKALIRICRSLSSVKIDPSRIELDQIVNAYGTYEVRINIISDIVAKVTLNILDK